MLNYLNLDMMQLIQFITQLITNANENIDVYILHRNIRKSYLRCDRFKNFQSSPQYLTNPFFHIYLKCQFSSFFHNACNDSY